MVKIEHILEKGSGPINEDRLIIDNNIFGVFDGATSLEDSSRLPETGGSLAATIAGNTFAKNHYPLSRLGESANAAILKQMKAAGLSADRPELAWSTSAAVVRLLDQNLEWFKAGDAQIMLLYEDGRHEILADRPDHDYETLLMFKQAQNNTLSNPVLKKQVLKVRSGMNKRYGVLNGDPRAMAFAAGGMVDLAGVKSILLFTDGLTLPCPDPCPKREFAPLAEAYRKLGLSGLHQKIRTMEKQDPDRRRFPRFKCHDDVAAIALQIK